MGGDIAFMQSSALPNIIGKIGKKTNDGLLFNGYAPNLILEGPFACDTGESYAFSNNTSYSNMVYSITFDASKSNEIYGKSDKVLPESFALIAQIKY